MRAPDEQVFQDLLSGFLLDSSATSKGGNLSKNQQPILPVEAIHIAETAPHFVYMLSCADGTLYTGYTTNVARRLAAHQAGLGARYTRGRRPVTLVARWAFLTKGEALRAEHAIKRLPRAEKLRLVQLTKGEEALS